MEGNTDTDLKSRNVLASHISLETLERTAVEMLLPVRFLVGLLSVALDSITDLLGRVVGSGLVRKHFHLVLSGLVLFGPALSLSASKYSVFANSNNYLYRKFLRSTWGWTFLLSSSFVILLSLSARFSLSLSLRHLSRLGLVGLLLLGCRRVLTLLEDAAGTCYEPVTSDAPSSSSSSSSPLLLLHEDQTKASCLRAGLLWRGYELSQDVLVLCFCCLLLVEELSAFARHLLRKPPGGPLRLVFLLCVVLLLLWMFLLLCLLVYFPKCPSQQLGGALGYLGWRALYQGWYRLGPGWICPGLPGEGLFPPADTQKQTQ